MYIFCILIALSNQIGKTEHGESPLKTIERHSDARVLLHDCRVPFPLSWRVSMRGYISSQSRGWWLWFRQTFRRVDWVCDSERKMQGLSMPSFGVCDLIVYRCRLWWRRQFCRKRRRSWIQATFFFVQELPNRARDLQRFILSGSQLWSSAKIFVERYISFFVRLQPNTLRIQIFNLSNKIVWVSHIIIWYMYILSTWTKFRTLLCEIGSRNS